MKNKTWIIAIILFYLAPTSGQNYQPVVGNTSTIWSIPVVQFSEMQIDTLYALDSSENGHYELWYHGEWFTEQTYYFGTIRPDEQHAKLYYTAPESDEEILIMDMNLMPGDSFPIHTRYGTILWSIVDSVYEANGLKHIQFEDHIGVPVQLGNLDKRTFIEGVGPNWGFGPLMEESLPAFYFICKHEGNTLFYSLTNSHIQNCDFRVNKIIKTENIPLHFFPNPAHDKIHIIADFFTFPLYISIWNLQGSVILEKSLCNGCTSIDISSIPTGCYFIKYQTENKVYVEKIIKK